MDEKEIQKTNQETHHCVGLDPERVKEHMGTERLKKLELANERLRRKLQQKK